MDVRFIGSGDAFGSCGRFQTCIQLHSHHETTLIDAGATTLTAMKSQGIDPAAVDTVVISHLHADHFGGLPLLILDGQFSHRTNPLTIVGPTGTPERLRAAMEVAFPGSSSVQRRFDVVVVELEGTGEPVAVGSTEVSAWQVDHPSGAPALAVRVRQEAVSVAYSGDTAWTPVLREASDGTDLFVCEAYTYDRPVPFHLDYTDVARNAHTFNTRQLILTHLGRSALARLDEIELPAAHDGLTLDLQPPSADAAP